MAVKVNLSIDQGSTFATTFNLTNDETGEILDLSTYTAAGQIRKHYSSSNAVNFVCTSNVSTGVLAVSLSANTTRTMTAGRYVYDVELTETVSGAVSRVVEGIVTVNPEVTR